MLVVSGAISQAIIESLLKRAQARYSRATLGISLVSNDATHAQKRCQSVLNFIERNRETNLEDTQMEIL